jgi:hypothetical protein
MDFSDRFIVIGECDSSPMTLVMVGMTKRLIDYPRVYQNKKLFLDKSDFNRLSFVHPIEGRL